MSDIDNAIASKIGEYFAEAHRMQDTEKLLNNWLDKEFKIWYSDGDGFYDYAVDGEWQDKKLLWAQLLAEILQVVADKIKASESSSNKRAN